jgi:hypothetical protein
MNVYENSTSPRSSVAVDLQNLIMYYYYTFLPPLIFCRQGIAYILTHIWSCKSFTGAVNFPEVSVLRSTKRITHEHVSYITTWLIHYASSITFLVRWISMSINSFQIPGFLHFVISSNLQRRRCKHDSRYQAKWEKTKSRISIRN